MSDLLWTKTNGWLQAAATDRPRHYAAIIARLTTKDARRQALEQAPAHWRGLIREHVITAMSKARQTGKTTP